MDYYKKLIEFTKTQPEKALKIYTSLMLLATILGMVFGLCVLGWYVFPVEWTHLGFQHLDVPHKIVLVNVASEWYAYSLNKQKASQFIYNWQGHELACQLAIQEEDLARKARLIALAATVTGDGCNE